MHHLPRGVGPRDRFGTGRHPAWGAVADLGAQHLGGARPEVGAHATAGGRSAKSAKHTTVLPSTRTWSYAVPSSASVSRLPSAETVPRRPTPSSSQVHTTVPSAATPNEGRSQHPLGPPELGLGRRQGDRLAAPGHAAYRLAKPVASVRK